LSDNSHIHEGKRYSEGDSWTQDMILSQPTPKAAFSDGILCEPAKVDRDIPYPHQIC